MRPTYRSAVQIFLVFFISAFGVSTASAAMLAEISTTDGPQLGDSNRNQGWYATSILMGDTVVNHTSNSDYIVGKFSSTNYRNYFTFDLSTLPNTAVISDLTLTLRRGTTGSVSPTQRNETIGFFDVTTSAQALNENVDPPSLDVFDDLGTGMSYGEFLVVTAPDQQAESDQSSELLDFNLNAAAVADAQSKLGGYFSIGGALQTATAFDDRIFALTGGSSAILSVTFETSVVPLPGVAFLFFPAVLSLLVWRRER